MPMKITDDMISSEIDATEKAISLEKHKTQLKKSEFIREIKNGLGKEIKSNPNTIKVIKKPWYTRLKLFLAKIFTRF
jgi:hypothetical protein